MNDAEIYEVTYRPIHHERFGKCIEERWSQNTVTHRRNGPAVSLRLDDGTLLQEEFFRDGKRDREAGAAIIIHVSPREEHWYREDLLHRPSGRPAITVTAEDGLVLSETYMEMGVETRIGGPAHIIRSPDSGICILERYSRMGFTSRYDGPAIIERGSVHGNIIREEWRQAGELERPDGAAVVIRDPKFSHITEQHFFRAGLEFDPI